MHWIQLVTKTSVLDVLSICQLVEKQILFVVFCGFAFLFGKLNGFHTNLIFVSSGKDAPYHNQVIQKFTRGWYRCSGDSESIFYILVLVLVSRLRYDASVIVCGCGTSRPVAVCTFLLKTPSQRVDPP